MGTHSVSLLALVLLVPFGASGRQVDNARLHSLIMEGIDKTLSLDYSRADSVFKCAAMEFPEHPAGYLYQAAVLQSRAMDYETQIDKSRFDSLLQAGKERAKALIKKAPDSPWGHYFLGTAHGCDSYASAYRGDWLGGALEGFASVSELKKTIALDSTLYDAYVGIGAFYYWRSRRTEHFNWLPFLGDDRDLAFVFLDRSIRNGTYNRYVAISMATTIYIDAEQYEEAERLASRGLERYPANRAFLWELATALEKGKKYVKAAHAYERLLQAILEGNNDNHYNEIVCRLNLVEAKLAIGDSSDVEMHLYSILSYERQTFSAHLQERARDKFRKAHDLQSELTHSDARGQ